ncbi:ubiquitin carboxyl-terminal hydrolase 43 isoform X2 [Denticeps clupeoides]|uniref:ubiquitinyl hydrolase 1 n=1 Tax=Denticeps clupeoides TaxID=299321 RepID=A0AAY4CNX5_9TELE|nr:ubiquitin carboxyl-terminal hydrolase 43-like isoform X2 [Denticeps clupeoides]
MEKGKKKPGAAARLFRKKSLKSVGSFVHRIFRTLGTWAQVGDAEPPDAEDDDGGFRDGAPCTLGASPAGLKDNQGPESQKSSAAARETLPPGCGDKTPGVLGLKNHGNTCFMNAVVQCLSNTDLLAEYLGLERYKRDKRDAGGEVTERLARLVRGLWTLEYTPQVSVDFKATVSKYGSQFRGNSQHDALEFLLWLLDRVHEDINSTTNNNNRIKAILGTEESTILDSGGQHQAGIHHSFVQEHFQAQYKSSLTCPHCHKQSNTFDPFLCISLPIPLRQTRPVCVTLVFSTKGQRYLRIGLAVPLFGSLATLRRLVADEGQISPDQVILAEIYKCGFQRSFFDEDDLTSIAENDTIYAFQASPLYIRGGSARISGYHHSLPSSPYSTSGPEGQRLLASGAHSSEFLNHGVPVKILLLVCNASGTGQQAVRFGPPFLMREDRSVSWEELQQSVLSKLYYLMINGAQPQNARVLFRIRVVGGSVSCSYLSPQDSRPLYHPAVDRALRMCGSGGAPHVKLVVEWEDRIKSCLFGNIQEEVVKDAESVRLQQQQHVQQYSCTLDECFQLYTKEEQLAPDDAWKCPHCQQLQQGTVQMSLWTLPDILILHLKRFRQVGEHRNKLSTLVRFPLTALDMAPHVVKRHHAVRRRNLQQQQLLPQAQRSSPPGVAPHPTEDFLYDLYAVCNHHGGMHGGHYTAYCRNSVDGQWYSYDDSNVESVAESEVCTRGAYILFYQRRNTIPAWSASCSLRGSTSSSISDHWLIRLTGDSPSLSPMAPLAVTAPVFQPVQGDTDGFETRPFVRGTQGRSVSLRSPPKASKESLARVFPLQWSFRSKDCHKPVASGAKPGELVEYLESGRRPPCSNEPIITLVSSPSTAKAQLLAKKGETANSPSLRCSEKSGNETPGSPRVPEGQCRRLSEPPRGGSINQEDRPWKGSKSGSRTVQDASFGIDSSSSPANPVSSPIVPPSRDSALKRARVQLTLPTVPKAGEMDRPVPVPEEWTRTTGGETKGLRDSSVSLSLKAGILVKDQIQESEKQRAARESISKHKLSNGGSSARLMLSNGTLGGALENLSKTRHTKLVFNGKECHGDVNPTSPTDIKRAHSSSSIQGKMDTSLRRAASLQKNGPFGPLMVDKPSFATLQRVRYSTTSLGRPRRVPESCF